MCLSALLMPLLYPETEVSVGELKGSDLFKLLMLVVFFFCLFFAFWIPDSLRYHRKVKKKVKLFSCVENLKIFKHESLYSF